MKIVLDTNIFIAAALKGGFSEDIIKMAANGIVVLICSEEILLELYKKLVKKFAWTTADAQFFVDTIKDVAEIVANKEKVSVIKNDPDDNKILECALAGKADLIVSSDKDLIQLKTFQGIAIIHPSTLHWIFPKYFRK